MEPRGRRERGPEFLHRARLVGGRKMAVPERHRQVLVPEELLHGAEVHAGHDQMRRERVAKRVPRRARDVGAAAGAAEGGVDCGSTHAFTPWLREYGGTDTGEGAEGRLSSSVERHVPRLAVLRLGSLL